MYWVQTLFHTLEWRIIIIYCRVYIVKAWCRLCYTKWIKYRLQNECFIIIYYIFLHTYIIPYICEQATIRIMRNTLQCMMIFANVSSGAQQRQGKYNDSSRQKNMGTLTILYYYHLSCMYVYLLCFQSHIRILCLFC